MVFPLLPLVARLRRRFAPADLTTVGERIELAPAGFRRRLPAIALPGEFDRATGFYETQEIERERLEAGPRAEPATIAYRVEDALVAGGMVVAGRASEIYRNDGPRVWLAGKAERRGEALLATTPTAETYFGDWLAESLSLGLMAEARRSPAVGFARQPWLHEPGYRALVGLPIDPVGMARFDALWIVHDIGLNEDRARRFREVRDRLCAQTRDDDAPEHVFLARGTLGKQREMGNADAVTEVLAARGFVTVHPEQETVAGLAAKLSRARIVVAMEGSAHVHALVAMPEGGALLNIQPPHRFTVPAKGMADMAGLHYAYVVGDAEADGFTVDVGRLAATLELVEHAIG